MFIDDETNTPFAVTGNCIFLGKVHHTVKTAIGKTPDFLCKAQAMRVRDTRKVVTQTPGYYTSRLGAKGRLPRRGENCNFLSARLVKVVSRR